MKSDYLARKPKNRFFLEETNLKTYSIEVC
jgi:hypothetical protein